MKLHAARSSTVRLQPAVLQGAALLCALVWLLVCGGMALFAQPARAQTASSTDAGALKGEVESLLHTQALPHAAADSGAPPWRVEVTLGQLDPRLRLAPCQKVHAYIPNGMRLWGKTRVGLRCEQGPVRWNVFWPVTVKVWSKAVVATGALRPGTLLTDADLTLGEVDLASSSSPVVLNASEVVGRSVLRSIAPGQGLHQDDIKARRWFAAGDLVRLVVKGQGFLVGAEGTALSPGDEGRCARIRLDGGRVVCGDPVGERQAEILL